MTPSPAGISRVCSIMKTGVAGDRELGPISCSKVSLPATETRESLYCCPIAEIRQGIFSSVSHPTYTAVTTGDSMERMGRGVMFLIRNVLVGALAGACLGLLVCIASIPQVMSIGFSRAASVSTIERLAVITAIVGAICGAVLLPIFALFSSETSSWKIARRAVIGGLVGVIIAAFVTGFFRPNWATDGTFVGAVLGSATGVGLLRRARPDRA